MRAERERQAKLYRSEGLEETEKIKSGADKERAVILAEAERQAEALCLNRLGKRCVILDADLGLANVDVVLGMTPEKNLFHVFHEGVSLGISFTRRNSGSPSRRPPAA